MAAATKTIAAAARGAAVAATSAAAAASTATAIGAIVKEERAARAKRCQFPQS